MLHYSAEDDLTKVLWLPQATIYQSLPVHANIIRHYRTLQNSKFLLFVLESLSGLNLLDYLESSGRHDNAANTQAQYLDIHITLPRMRTITSMFTQMCEAVAECHEASVYHRNIKLHNFVILDQHTYGDDEYQPALKLVNFEHASREEYSSDLGCGSPPYMSYGAEHFLQIQIYSLTFYLAVLECANDVSSTYNSSAADVWSLGIVLINMYVKLLLALDSRVC